MAGAVDLFVEPVDGRWFGLAVDGAAVAATAVGPTRERTLDSLRRSLPPGVACRFPAEKPDFARQMLALLADLEAGREDGKGLSLAPDCIGEPLASILRVAASIPLGYVTTYGDVARAAGADARDVGTAMARNPIYPIVPCHRVVGAGFALVGYAGSRGPAALRSKLDRLVRETRGFREEREIATPAGPLRVYPVERAIARAEDDLGTRQRLLFEGDAAPGPREPGSGRP